VYNLCLAQGKQLSTGGALTEAVGLDMFHTGLLANSYRVINNIISAGSWSNLRYGVTESSSNPAVRFTTNVITPDPAVASPGIAYYLLFNGTEMNSEAAVNGLNQPFGQRVFLNNRVLAPGFAAPNPAAPLAAGYHLSAACALGDLGDAIANVEPLDYDGAVRDTGTAAVPPAPEPGPDECP
jgi:hypothetical protein